MLAYFARLIVFAIVTLTTLSSSADWLCDFGNTVARDTKRRNCWPAPFECFDRQTARTPFAIMVSNGWRKQNMLGDFHFEPTTGQLTEAGKLKIRWIVFEASAQHRDIFVHIGETPEETEIRLACVRAQAAFLVPENEIPPITQTKISAPEYPAQRLQIIKDHFQPHWDQPELPTKDQSSTNSGGSSSGGGSGP